jgi:methyl-accepting chemotaxis protein
METYLRQVRDGIILPEAPSGDPGQMLKLSTAAIDAAFVVADAARSEFLRLAAQRLERLKHERTISFVAVGAALLLVLYLFLAFRSYLIGAIAAIDGGARRMAAGDFAQTVDVDSGDELAGIAAGLNSTQAQLRERIEAEREVARANLRIRNALDVSSNSVMVADTDGNIIYCNAAVLAMLRNAEADIRRQLPDFRADAVPGSNIDRYHRQPGHQRKLLAELAGTHRV